MSVGSFHPKQKRSSISAVIALDRENCDGRFDATFGRLEEKEKTKSLLNTASFLHSLKVRDTADSIFKNWYSNQTHIKCQVLPYSV